MPDGDPYQTIRSWLPHLVVVAVLAFGLWLLALVFAPVAEPILLAASLALLTTHVLFSPIDSLLRQHVPGLSQDMRRYVAGIAATLVLVAVAVAPMLLLMASTLGSISRVLVVIYGIIVGDVAQFEVLQLALQAEIVKVGQLYPNLDLPSRGIDVTIVDMLRSATDFGPNWLSYLLFKGGGALAQVILSLIALTYFYMRGGDLSRVLLSYSPLEPRDIQALHRRHRRIVLRLLNDTIATAVVKGIALASLVWLVDQGIGTRLIPFVPVALFAMAMNLLPVVGVAMVWLPIVLLFWSSGHPQAAIVVGAGSLLVHFGVNWIHRRIGRRIDHERHDWMGFLLFLGLIGGLLGFGLKGFIIGPMAVVLVYILGAFWLPLYGLQQHATSTSSDKLGV